MANDCFAKLSWKLLEAKVRYYLYPLEDNISDAEYDHLETEYVRLCKELNKPNTVQSMVGVNTASPSVQFVRMKIEKGAS